MNSDSDLALCLRKDLQVKQTCGIDYIYVPAFHPDGRPKQGRIVVFNDSGLFLWHRLQPFSSFNLAQAISILREEYDIDEEKARHDVKTLLNEWYLSELLDKC